MEFREWLELNEGIARKGIVGLIKAANKALSLLSPAIIGAAMAALGYAGWQMGGTGFGPKSIISATAGGYFGHEFATGLMEDLERYLLDLEKALDDKEKAEAAKKVLIAKTKLEKATE